MAPTGNCTIGEASHLKYSLLNALKLSKYIGPMSYGKNEAVKELPVRKLLMAQC